MLIVGIAGGTGSGKTTVVRKIMEVFPNDEVIVIPQDSYYKDNIEISLEERQKINFDHPDSVEFSLLIDHLKQLKKGRSVEMPVYSYADDRLGRVIQRDIIERGRSVIIIPRGGENEVGIEVLISIIEKHLLQSKS